MKGFGRWRDRGEMSLQKWHSLIWSVSVSRAAVPQVANAFHVATKKRCTAIDLRRECVTGRQRGPILRQAGPGGEPITRLPKPPDFSVVGPAVLGQSFCAGFTAGLGLLGPIPASANKRAPRSPRVWRPSVGQVGGSETSPTTCGVVRRLRLTSANPAQTSRS